MEEIPEKKKIKEKMPFSFDAIFRFHSILSSERKWRCVVMMARDLAKVAQIGYWLSTFITFLVFTC